MGIRRNAFIFMVYQWVYDSGSLMLLLSRKCHFCCEVDLILIIFYHMLLQNSDIHGQWDPKLRFSNFLQSIFKYQSPAKFQGMRELSRLTPINSQHCWILSGKEEHKPGSQVEGSIGCKFLLPEKVSHQPVGSMQRVGQLSL